MKKELTAQQIFEKVAKHLAKQGKKASKPGYGCLNFGPGETRCAIGCLVPRSVYRRDKSLGLGGLEIIRGALNNAGVNAKAHFDLLISLMTVHDNYDVGDWPNGLKRVAKRFNLKVPAWLEAVV